VRTVLSFLARFALVFLLVEGLCSAISTAAVLLKVIRESPRLYTRYDPLLGWVSPPGLSIPDLYGPGIGFHTNSRGFRGTKEVADTPAGRRRIVCSGDSFTLGVGVRDEDTWCAHLESMAPDIEAVNMGQAGYGIDQAYLWFKRDGARLGRRLHVFAFVSVDLDRMMTDRFVGFGKPYLDLEGGRLVTRNVPVPRGPYFFSWLTLLAPSLDELRSVSFARRLAGWSGMTAHPRGPRTSLLELLLAIGDDLEKSSEASGTHVVFVYLPTVADLTPNAAFDGWRDGLRSAIASRGFDYVDLVADFRAQSPNAADRLFLPATIMGRHYTIDGHLLVARLLRERLTPWLGEPGESLEATP